MKSILIIEDDITYGMILKTWLTKKGFEVTSVSSVAKAKKHIESTPTNLVLCDLRLPDGDGLSLLEWVNNNHLLLPLIMMTGYADIQTAVQAIKLGAKDYISKPINPEELLKKIDEALKIETSPILPPTQKVEPIELPANFLEGESDAAKQLYSYVRLVAPTNMSTLIIGASGTGKEGVAHQIHQLSKRSKQPFIAIDCGAIPKELAASEFFGHLKGSFTGALTDKTGAFVAANGGTVFLDEIGNLSYEIQIQLLRALQERKVKPIGSNKEIEVDIRLIAATNENLELAIETGNFREDLFHRINEFTLRIPDLKDRQNDILLFANFFLDQANRELDKQVIGFDNDATTALLSYHWPGNLRQMKNTIKRATLLAQKDFITCAELDNEMTDISTTNFALRNQESEQERIIKALQQTGYNKTKAAILLGIDRKTLYNKLKLYSIE